METQTERELIAKHRAMHLAGEKLVEATAARDEAIRAAATGDNAMPKAQIARTLGIRRETVYSAILRAQTKGTHDRR